jgi:hypothetical protein
MTRVLPRLLLWNVGFIVCLGAIVVYADRAISDRIGLSLPYIAGVWLLLLGAGFAKKRASVIAIAVVASLLLLLQCAVFGAGILLSPYHFEHRTQFQLLLAAAIVTGVAFVWWFIIAKLSRPKAQA